MSEIDEKKQCRKDRHPTKKGVANSTYSPPTISHGKRERALLRYLYDNKRQRFNLKYYARITGINRSTIYDYLNKLYLSGLITDDLANRKITDKGIALIESQEPQNSGVGTVSESSRRECRKNDLSTHYHKFKLQKGDIAKFRTDRISELAPTGWKENRLFNLHQLMIYLSDATIIINPNQVILNINDVIADDVDESDFECLSRAIKYANKLSKIGMETEGMFVESGHWARVQSILSDFIFEKIDDRYFIELDNGKKFWIDHSDGKREDETNDKELRKKFDNLIRDLEKSPNSFSDIGKIIYALEIMVKLKFLEEKSNYMFYQQPSTKRPDYFG